MNADPALNGAFSSLSGMQGPFGNEFGSHIASANQKAG
jgi:hypothetical protein